jgi:hypothetical protein
LITASVLAGISLWNSLGFSWTNSRLELAREAYLACDAAVPQDATSASKDQQSYIDQDEMKVSNWIWSDDSNKIFPAGRQNADKDPIKESLRKFKLSDQKNDLSKHIEKNPYFGNTEKKSEKCALYKKQAEELMEAHLNDIKLIRIPFFNCLFDINDLGIISGLSFFIALFWFRSALSSERRNIKVAFASCFDQEGKSLAKYIWAYDLLSMHQALFSPPELEMVVYQESHKVMPPFMLKPANEDRYAWPPDQHVIRMCMFICKQLCKLLAKHIRHILSPYIIRKILSSYMKRQKKYIDTKGMKKYLRLKVFRLLTYVLMIFPFLIQLGIVINDHLTSSDVSALGILHGKVTTRTDDAFLFLILCMTYSCIRQARKTNEVWMNHYYFITREKPLPWMSKPEEASKEDEQ